jgi:Protein of unknown function (DUF3579)
MHATSCLVEHAAPQHIRGTIRPPAGEPLRASGSDGPQPTAQRAPMTSPDPRQYFIQGVTLDGQTFRPSDWAERLAGAMSSFRPDGMHGGIGAYIGYSPLCVPRLVNGVKCVIVSEALKDVEPMAWDFVMNFARDNRLQLAEACLVPPAGAPR